MTKNELLEILKERFYISKTEFNRSFTKVQQKVMEKGIILTKIGRGDNVSYELKDLSCISDFRKPLIIRRDMHVEQSELCVGGIPLRLFEDIHYPYQVAQAWFYLMNCKDGDIIDFKIFGSDDYKTAIYLDNVMCCGFLVETNTNIIFYADNYYNSLKRYCCYHWQQSDRYNRLMPIVK